MSYRRWGKNGAWLKLLSSVLDVPDLEYLMVDGSIIRVHQHGAAKKSIKKKAVGKSRGGSSTKIHAAVDALGNPVRLSLTASQVSEHTQAEALIEGFRPDLCWQTRAMTLMRLRLRKLNNLPQNFLQCFNKNSPLKEID
jgi:Transposase DDE domain